MEETNNIQGPRYFTVRVYLQDVAYGGPEEGGWHYITGELALEFVSLTRCFLTRDKAAQYAATVNEQYLTDINLGRPDIGSVLSQGRYVAEVWDGEAPPYYPIIRPHYE